MLDLLLNRLAIYCLLFVLFTGVIYAQPTVSGTSSALSYTENAGAITVDPNLTIISSVSQDQIQSATVEFVGYYDELEDSLLIDPLVLASTSLTITSTNWNEPGGQYSFSGNKKTADYQELLRAIKYINRLDTPVSNTRTIAFQVTDGNGISNLFTRNITINPVNDAPWFHETMGDHSVKADTIRFTAEEDKVKTFCPNIYDLEGDGYTLSVSSTAETSGTVVVNSGSPGCVDFLSELDFVGEDYFELSVCDESNGLLCYSAVFEVTVTAVNDAPRIYDFGSQVDSMFFGTAPNTPIEICLDSIYDPEGDNFIIEEVIASDEGPYQYGNVSGLSGVCFTYTPDPDSVAGTEFIKVTVVDDGVPPRRDSVIIEVQYPVVNTAPAFATAGKDTVTYGVIADDVLQVAIQITDRERDDLVLSKDTVLLGHLDSLTAQINANGDSLKFTYRPNPEDSSTQAVLRFTICDDKVPALCKDLTVIVPINYVPVLVDEDGTILEEIYLPLMKNTQADTCVGLVDLNSNSVFESATTSTALGTLTSNVDNQNDKLCMTYTPPTDFEGLDTLTLTLCDNGDPEGCSEIMVVCEVFPTNTAPVLTDADLSTFIALFEVNENDTVDLCLPFVDVEGDAVTLESYDTLSGPGEFTFDLSGTNVCMNYLPELNVYGKAEAVVTLCDDNDFPVCQTYVVALNLNPVNYNPILGDDEVEIFTSDEITINLLENDVDPEGEGLFILQDQTPETSILGDIVIENDSIVRYIPNPDEYKGTETISITICDGGIPEVCVESTLSIKFSLPIPPLKAYEGFSPNGDGINDVWWIDGITEFPKNTVIVTDEYYNVVYEARGYDNHDVIWTGNSQLKAANGPADEGTYYYVIDTGSGRRLTGYVMLKR